MPEGTSDAAVLIATSWQALNRALSGRQDTLLCDCTVVVLFAGFYVEANLNHIIDQLHKTPEMKAFVGQRYPGLQDKLAWFYNEYLARRKATTGKDMFHTGVAGKVRRRFPGFAGLYRFRNDISHGVINRTARSLVRSKRLRQQAKAIVNDLFAIAEKAGHSIPRDVNYYDAIR